MKKIISLMLALIILVAMLSTVTFADEEMSDTFTFEQVTSKTSEKGLFTLNTDYVDKDGWSAGSYHPFAIIAAEGLIITRIEAEIGYYEKNYGKIGVSGGATKQPMFEKDGIKMASITNINSSKLSIKGDEPIQFKNITVYYNSHSYGEDNICSVCGKTRCEIEGHDYDYICHYCGGEAPEGYVPDNDTASVLSDGNMTIVCSVAAAAFGFLAAMFIFKKKPASANTEEE